MSALDVEARAICAARAAWWEQLAAFNAEGRKTGEMADALFRADDEINQRVEALRRAFFPRAHRLIVQYDEAITVSRTGRSTRRVWVDTARTAAARW